MRFLPTTLILLAAATAAQAQPPAPTDDTVLAANHAAVGNIPAIPRRRNPIRL
jgi:hypothetical protein